jgi:indole-3-acetate monooxygenase
MTVHDRCGKTPDIVAAAKRLAPRIKATREEAEKLRRTPADLAGAIADAGLYQMFLPRSAGGPELPPMTVFEAIEELSKADGSVGWCAMIATDVSYMTGPDYPGFSAAFDLTAARV